MLGKHKKQNPTPAAIEQGGPPAVLLPRELPPLRTFVVRSGEFVYVEKEKAWVRANQRVVEAHGLGIDDARMISFVVFFFLDEAKTQPAQAQKLVLNADAWDEVEEINPLFPTLEKH